MQLKNNKRLLPIVISLVLIFQSCDKGLNGNGAIAVTVQYQAAALKTDSIYQTGSTAHPVLSAVTNASGEVIFNNISPGKYYLSVQGQSGGSQPVYGTDSITVRKRFRENTYDVIIETLQR